MGRAARREASGAGMKQRLRLALTFFSFFMFFTAGVLLGVLVFPIMRLVVWSRARYRRLASRVLGFLYPSFLFWMKLAGLVAYERAPLPEFMCDGRPFVLVANHPTLIDVVFLLGWVPGLTTTVKAAWLRSWLAGPLLRAADYVPGPSPEDEEVGGTPALDRMVAKLEEGRPLIVFPEGTRSPTGALHRFRRGAFEAAARAGVPVVLAHIDARPAGLNKERFLPREPMRFRFEWLGVIEPGPNARELMRQAKERIAAAHARAYAEEREAGTLATQSAA